MPDKQATTKSIVADEALPAFLAADVLGEVLGGAVVRHVAARAMGAGDGFLSSMLGVKVTVQREGSDEEVVEDIIVKRMPEPSPQDLVSVRDCYATETRVYTEIMPRVMALLQSIGKGEPPLGPRMLHSAKDGKHPILYIEDIGTQGFRLPSRDEGLDVPHTRLALRRVARWHAATARLLQDEPGLLDGHRRAYCAEHKMLITLVEQGYARFLQHLASWDDELSRRVLPKMQRLFEGLERRVLAAHEPDAVGLAVGLHGDLWTANMLFEYGDDGQPQDLRLIDYQLCARGSPASDLLYFRSTLGAEAIRQRHQLIAEYHAELAECLRALGVARVPDLAQFKADLIRRGVIEVVHVAAGTALFIAPRELLLRLPSLVDVEGAWDEARDGPHPKDEALEREPARRLIREHLAAWESDGLLDALLAQTAK